ncbi:MAG: hypothetical protein EOS24_26065 [Mesorhizobium sp.]|uniref:hypothetical protein n=1 Tax=Mesorhizobium sp. TaxID=1871066 RepID=UPI000FE6DBD1|nr:hypothetical protein [Mesorhizobium sp.]RWE53859.1 MAG: hypothetical protein EOS24_26065 [Mesorhizobium sp.]
MSAGFTPTPEMLDAVAEWRQRRPDEQVRRAIVPILRDRFSIGPAEAVEVVRQSNAGGADAS